MTISSIKQIGLADLYGNAGIEVDPDRFSGRQAAVDSISADADTHTQIGLAKIAFGLSSGEVADRIVAAVREDDPSFNSKAYAREMSIIAVSGLEELSAKGQIGGIHAVLAFSACSQRTCEVDDQLVKRMEGRRRELTVREANFSPETSINITDLKIDNLEELTWAFATNAPQGGQNLSAALQNLVDALTKSVNSKKRALAKAMHSRLAEMNQKLDHQQNELELLWWLFGGWSTMLEAPFSQFGSTARSLLVGYDLGQMSNLRGSPTAVGTFAERAIGAIEKANKNCTLRQLVGALDLNQIKLLNLEELDLEDKAVFPVLGTLKLRLDRAVEANEDSLYDGIDGIKSKSKHSVFEWAEHVFNEVALARLKHEDSHEHA